MYEAGIYKRTIFGCIPEIPINTAISIRETFQRHEHVTEYFLERSKLRYIIRMPVPSALLGAIT